MLEKFKNEIFKKYTSFDKNDVKHSYRIYKIFLEDFELS